MIYSSSSLGRLKVTQSIKRSKAKLIISYPYMPLSHSQIRNLEKSIMFLTHPPPLLSYVTCSKTSQISMESIFSFFQLCVTSILVSITVISWLVYCKWFPKEYSFHPFHSVAPSFICSTPCRYGDTFETQIRSFVPDHTELVLVPHTCQASSH